MSTDLRRAGRYRVDDGVSGHNRIVEERPAIRELGGFALNRAVLQAHPSMRICSWPGGIESESFNLAAVIDCGPARKTGPSLGEHDATSQLDRGTRRVRLRGLQPIIAGSTLLWKRENLCANPPISVPIPLRRCLSK